ncbi:MAG: DUF4296 domain-containing protein [Flavobacteriaceae bacterium]|nr:DUF4296 domain-containing protein [Flavobacteriaceae bacterium]
MKNIYLIILVFFVFSCQEIDKEKKPKDLIARDKMADVMYDIVLLNAAKSYSPKMIENSDIDYQKYVYERHGIDSLQFARSSNYYSHHLDTYISIYNAVENKLLSQKRIWKDSLDVQKKIQDSLATAARRKQDSISKLKNPKNQVIQKVDTLDNESN